jgi:hypothetical protein
VEEENKVQAYGKRPLWQWIVLYVVVAVLVYGLIYYFVLAKKGGYSSSNSAAVPGYTAPTTAMQSTPSPKPTTMMQKFSDSSDFQYGYKIFPGTLSSESKQAMAGFAFTTKAMPDGSTQITLTAQNPFYKTQQYTVKPGFTLYFIERNIKDDDAQKDSDAMTLDDAAVLVDSQGYIAQ